MADDFHRLVARLPYPMWVLTTVAADDGERAGCLVGFATQCSIHPPRYAVWVSERNRTCRVAARAEAFVMHALAVDDRDLAELFGGETGDEVDKFERCSWHPGPLGLPVVDGTAGWFAARIVDRLPPTGDHVGYLVEPFDAWLPAGPDVPDLTYQETKDIDPGHAP